MNPTPTPVTAALAGTFSGLTWPWVWPLVQGTAASGSVWIMVATVVLVALPAHAFVLGFKRTQPTRRDGVESALFVRVGVWLACAVAAAIVVSFFRAST